VNLFSATGTRVVHSSRVEKRAPKTAPVSRRSFSVVNSMFESSPDSAKVRTSENGAGGTFSQTFKT
jgi:hypothetical protein